MGARTILPLPLDNYYYSRLFENDNIQNAQIYGKNFVQCAGHFSLDKLYEVW